jgi:hypothetical protein
VGRLDAEDVIVFAVTHECGFRTGLGVR